MLCVGLQDRGCGGRAASAGWGRLREWSQAGIQQAKGESSHPQGCQDLKVRQVRGNLRMQERSEWSEKLEKVEEVENTSRDGRVQ